MPHVLHLQNKELNVVTLLQLNNILQIAELSNSPQQCNITQLGVKTLTQAKLSQILSHLSQDKKYTLRLLGLSRCTVTC